MVTLILVIAIPTALVAGALVPALLLHRLLNRVFRDDSAPSVRLKASSAKASAGEMVESLDERFFFEN